MDGPPVLRGQHLGGQRVQGGAGLAHQNECVHDILANLQAGGARHFQEQITCGFLNLKKKLGRVQERTKLSQADTINADVPSAENPMVAHGPRRGLPEGCSAHGGLWVATNASSDVGEQDP